MYRLEKDGVRFTLLPLRSGSCPKVSKADKITFFTITHLEYDMGATIEESKVVRALIVE